MSHSGIEVELVEHTPGRAQSGIGRYTHGLYGALSERATVRLAVSIDPPLARRLSFLHALPLGVRAHQPGAIVHFMQIMGCAQMLWRPTRPAVAAVHDLGLLAWSPEAAMYNRFDRALVRLSFAALRRMDAIVADSEYSRRSVVELLGIPPQRTHTVMPGIEHERFRPIADAAAQLAKRYPLPEGPGVRRLLYVGSELPRKDLATLLEALARLREADPGLHLLKVGGSGGAAFRAATERAIARLGLGGCVHRYEGVPDDDLPLFYGAADLFVCPSLLEGFGFPALEALACGTPVVCSAAGSLPELTGDAALRVAPGDVDGFVRAIAEVLARPRLAADLRARGREQARRFTWERTAREALAVYHQLAARRDSRTGYQPLKGSR